MINKFIVKKKLSISIFILFQYKESYLAHFCLIDYS